MTMQTLLLLLVLSIVLDAQETRTEVTKATTPADDSKANSDKVPEVYALSGNFSRVVVLRFKYQADLLAGIERHDEAGENSERCHSRRRRIGPELSDPFRLKPDLSVEEHVRKEPHRARRYHQHERLHHRWQDSCAHDDGESDRAFGGHLEPGTNVFTFAIVTIGVMNDVDLSKVDDKTYR